jgi:hypothetical protein
VEEQRYRLERLDWGDNAHREIKRAVAPHEGALGRLAPGLCAFFEAVGPKTQARLARRYRHLPSSHGIRVFDFALRAGRSLRGLQAGDQVAAGRRVRPAAGSARGGAPRAEPLRGSGRWRCSSAWTNDQPNLAVLTYVTRHVRRRGCGAGGLGGTRRRSREHRCHYEGARVEDLEKLVGSAAAAAGGAVRAGERRAARAAEVKVNGICT